ncbi:MAG: Uncharacterised protein [Methanobacteriota archaeon]|nr:MAG: Uncharacterised protein [Euryarchaeota archaeon]
MKYSCSYPNQKSLSSSSIVARPLLTWGVPSGFITSHITRKPFILCGSGKIATGSRRQSDAPPSACLVDEPSNIQVGHSSKVPPKFERTIVLLRMFCVGSYPSSQMYSNFALSIIGIALGVRSTVYYTIAQKLRRLCY